MSALPQQNTEEWLNWRKDKIGASDIPIIMGVSPYTTPLQLWKRKLGFEKSPPTTYAQNYGNENESKVRTMLQLKYMKRIDPKVVVSASLEWAVASLDGIDEDGCIYEIKCCSAEEYELAVQGQVPDKYYPQLQWQMFVAEADYCVYAAFNKGKVAIVEVMFNEVYVEDALQAAADFYQSMIDYIEPEMSQRDYHQIDDEDFGKVAIDWLETKELYDQSKKRLEDLKKKMVEFTDDGNCEGYGVQLTRTAPKRNVDMKKLRDHYSISDDKLEEFKIEGIGFWTVRRKKVGA